VDCATIEAEEDRLVDGNLVHCRDRVTVCRHSPRVDLTREVTTICGEWRVVDVGDVEGHGRCHDHVRVGHSEQAKGKNAASAESGNHVDEGCRAVMWVGGCGGS
jgi:hypothetical protein